MSGCLIIPDKETAKARRELFGNSEQLDTISRQAAIDELERGKDKKAKGTVGGFYNQIIDNDIEKLRRLPSAQPAEADVQKIQDLEQAEIQKAYELGKLDAMEAHSSLDEWCADCAEYDKDRHCCPRFNRVIRNAMQSAETAKRIVAKSIRGVTMWYQCDVCHEPVDEKDTYCSGCGRKLING